MDRPATTWEGESFQCHKQRRLPSTVCLIFSEEATPGVIFTRYDSVLQDQSAILVMLVCLAACRMYVSCRLGTETEEKLSVLQCGHLVWGQDDGAEELSRSEQPPLPQALSCCNQPLPLTCSKRRSSGWWCPSRRRSRKWSPSPLVAEDPAPQLREAYP